MQNKVKYDCTITCDNGDHTVQVYRNKDDSISHVGVVQITTVETEQDGHILAEFYYERNGEKRRFSNFHRAVKSAFKSKISEDIWARGEIRLTREYMPRLRVLKIHYNTNKGIQTLEEPRMPRMDMRLAEAKALQRVVSRNRKLLKDLKAATKVP